MRTQIAVLTAAATAGALGVGGVALAAGPSETKQNRCETMLAKLAERRGVTVAELEATIKSRIADRIDRAVATGKIERARADTLKQKLASGPLCAVARGAHARAHHRAQLHRQAARSLVAGAARYLGVSQRELRAELKSGKSLAELATARGKDTAGLEAAMLAAVKAKLDKAVVDGRLTAERRDTLLERYTALAERLIDRKLPVSS